MEVPPPVSREPTGDSLCSWLTARGRIGQYVRMESRFLTSRFLTSIHWVAAPAGPAPVIQKLASALKGQNASGTRSWDSLVLAN